MTDFTPMPDLTELADEIHAQNLAAGWWDPWLEDKTKRHETAMMLVISEIAEAMEGHRKGLMDDHLPNEKMFDVELADAMIRLLDLAGAFKVDLITYDMLDGLTLIPNTITIPEQLFGICFAVTYVSGDCRLNVRFAIMCVIAVAHHNGVDLWRLVDEKRAYNAHRADHKRENREAAGGKKF